MLGIVATRILSVRISRLLLQPLTISPYIHTRKMSGELVKFPSENSAGDCHGYFVGNLPDNKAGLIVMHEWWGMNQQIKDHGAKLAKEGNLLVLVPDLYRGKVAEDQETAGHYMGNLDWQGAVKDVSACAHFLKSKGCVKVGITGFCMGGALAFAAAALIPQDISAAAPFYGLPSPSLADITKITVPVQAHFAEYDAVEGFSSKKDYTPAVKKMLDARVPLQFYEYKAGHGFCNPLNMAGPNYNEEAANLANSRMFEFFKKELSANCTAAL